jgi:aryl-alcohol dehydrogenase-like predicted oxidoreductase
MVVGRRVLGPVASHDLRPRARRAPQPGRRSAGSGGYGGPMAPLGRTGLDVFGLCLGGNVFGWTADEAQSREVLDAYAAAGGNFVDTANSYLVEHGRSETIIGRWMADRGTRDDIVLATKVGGGSGAVRNLRPETIEREAHASLQRLQTERIDLYYAHFDDEDTPLEDSLRAFDALVRAGTVRHLGASNYTPERLTAALELQRGHGLAEFTVLQPHFNLVERDVERTLLPVAREWDLAVLPYFALAKGFLTGKYRPGADGAESPRADAARAYLDHGGAAVLEALDDVAAAHGTTVAAVALAWLRAQPCVVAPIASARTTAQLEQILPAATLELTPAELDRLSATAAAA